MYEILSYTEIAWRDRRPTRTPKNRGVRFDENLFAPPLTDLESTMYPSIKTLSRIFGDNAREARELLEGKRNPADYPQTASWIGKCYRRPSTAELKMSALNELGDFSGVEAAFSDNSVTEPKFTYLNAGDTYSTTLVRYKTGTYRVTSWGDVVESMERRGVRF